MYYLSGAGHQQPYFIPDKSIFIPKIFCTFGQCVIFKNPYNPGYFTFPENPPWLPEGECVPLSPTTQFSTSRPLPSITQIPTQNTQKSFENYFDAPSKSPLLSTISNSLKIPQSPRIITKSHPKITKPQVKSTHSRTKTNNPIPTTKIHTTPPSHHTSNQHKNKAKTHIKALTQYAKTSLL